MTDTVRRAFILGAGFSKQAGMPLATELTSLILKGTDLKDLEEMQSWLADFRQRLSAAEGSGGGASGLVLNVEQMFDFAAYDAELWRMRQQLCPVGRGHRGSPWSKADAISTWLGLIEEQLAHVLWDRQKEADLTRIRRFAKELQESDVVLTFNYDTLLESALFAEGKAWNHGFESEGAAGVRVLKMHGSVDWILLKRRPEMELEKFVRLFSKTDTNVEEHGGQTQVDELEYAWELWRAKDTATCAAVLDMDGIGLSNFEYLLGLAGLGRYKPLHQLPGSARTWFSAFDALRNAHEAYVIGFSLSPYDTLARFHFASVMRERKVPLQRACIVDPCAERLQLSFERLFDTRVDIFAKAAEQVDWVSFFRSKSR